MSRDILLSHIDADPDQPRKHFDQAALDELTQSMQATGLLVSQCPAHHRAMRQNSRGWYCSAKLADSSYCTERA